MRLGLASLVGRWTRVTPPPAPGAPPPGVLPEPLGPRPSGVSPLPVVGAPVDRASQLVDVAAQRLEAWRLDERPGVYGSPGAPPQTLAAVERALITLADHLDKSPTKKAIAECPERAAELAGKLQRLHQGWASLTAMVDLSSRSELIRAAQRLDYAFITTPALEARVRARIVAPVVEGAHGNIEPWERALEALLRSKGPSEDYLAMLRNEVAIARASSLGRGLDFSASVGAWCSELRQSNQGLPSLSHSQLIASRTRPLPDDLVLYSWQSPQSAAAIVRDAAGYWPSIAQSGLYLCESPTSTSGYAGSASFGAMVEVRIPKGTPFADLDHGQVRSELSRRSVFHNHARTPDGALKPLNRYNEVSGWWHLPADVGAQFRMFDATRRPTSELLLMLAESSPAGLPFLAENINAALVARGEGPETVDRALAQRLDRKLSKWAKEDRSKGYSDHSSGVTDLLISLLEVSDRFPSISSRINVALAALDAGDRAELRKHAEYRGDAAAARLVARL